MQYVIPAKSKLLQEQQRSSRRRRKTRLSFTAAFSAGLRCRILAFVSHYVSGKRGSSRDKPRRSCFCSSLSAGVFIPRPRRETPGGVAMRDVFRVGRAFAAKLLQVDEFILPIESQRQRINTLGCVLYVFSALSVWRLYSLQGTEHLKWVKIASKQHQTSIEIQGARGPVVDSQGRTLAVSVPALAIAVHPHRIGNIETEAPKLAKVLGQDVSEIKEKLQSDKKFVWLARGVPAKQRAEIAGLRVPALEVFDEFRRYYPQGPLAGSLIGAVGTDGAGLSGVELRFNRQLSAPGYDVPVRRDARGRYVTVSAWEDSSIADFSVFRGLQHSMSRLGALGAALESSSGLLDDGVLRKEGKPIVLSIDSVIQDIVESEFQRGCADSKAQRVFGLVMDAENGELLALAQSPDTDPNNRAKLNPLALRNAVIQDGYEPGSTLKPIVAAAALEQELVRSDEIFNCENGRYGVGRYTIKDVHPIGVVSFSDVLVRSSNICMAKIGQRMGKKRLHRALSQFGFGRRTGIELHGESEGILRPDEAWAEIDVATHSFGQGVSVTALQLVQAYAALANGGILVKPTLLKQDETAAPGVRVLRPTVAHRITEILRGVTEDEHGTGSNARIAGVTVHGKTGTAQKAREDGRGYSANEILASFIGYVDGQEIGVNRKLVMIVAVDEPGVYPRWGGVVAAPVFRRSMERILSHLMTQEGQEVRTAALAATHAGLG